MTLRALMLDWSIPAPPDVRIASGTFHGFSPCLTWTANAPSFYHAVPDAAFAPTEKKDPKSKRAKGSRTGRLAHPGRRLVEPGPGLCRRDRFPYRHDPLVCLCSTRRARSRQSAAQLCSHHDPDRLDVARLSWGQRLCWMEPLIAPLL